MSPLCGFIIAVSELAILLCSVDEDQLFALGVVRNMKMKGKVSGCKPGTLQGKETLEFDIY